MAFSEFTGQLDQELPAGPVHEFSGELDAPTESAGVQQPMTPEPRMAAVAMNAVPKGIANLANTPHTLNGLVIRGLASLPGLDKLPEVKQFLEGIADNPEFNRNRPMEFMKKIGAVRPENEPQTGLQRIVDSAIQNVTQSLVIPASGAVNMAKGAGMSALSGATAQATKEATGSDLAAGIVGAATALAPTAIANMSASRNKQLLVNQTGATTLQKAQDMGFQVEPSKVRAPSALRETAAGKAAIAQATVENNQAVANQWAAKDIGLPPNQALSRDLLDTYKKTVAKPYQEVDQVFNQMKQSGQLPYFPRYHSTSLTDEWIEANQNANALWKSYWQNPDINVKKAAQAADAQAANVFKDIDMVAKASGDKTLPARLLAAKQQYAKVNDVESVLNPGSGNVSLEGLARLHEAGRPFSGYLKDMANFATAFPRSSRPLEKIPPSGVSGTDAAMAATLGTVGASGGSNAGFFSLGIPFVRNAAKNSVLSPEYQRSLLDAPQPKVPYAAAAARAAITGKNALDNGEKK